MQVAAAEVVVPQAEEEVREQEAVGSLEPVLVLDRVAADMARVRPVVDNPSADTDNHMAASVVASAGSDPSDTVVASCSDPLVDSPASCQASRLACPAFQDACPCPAFHKGAGIPLAQVVGLLPELVQVAVAELVERAGAE